MQRQIARVSVEVCDETGKHLPHSNRRTCAADGATQGSDRWPRSSRECSCRLISELRHAPGTLSYSVMQPLHA
jgi:hypothetical protein